MNFPFFLFFWHWPARGNMTLQSPTLSSGLIGSRTAAQKKLLLLPIIWNSDLSHMQEQPSHNRLEVILLGSSRQKRTRAYVQVEKLQLRKRQCRLMLVNRAAITEFM